MPLIVISGLPCSGKSTAAAALAEVCRQRGQEVQVVDEDSVHLQRNISYAGGQQDGGGGGGSACRQCLLAFGSSSAITNTLCPAQPHSTLPVTTSAADCGPPPILISPPSRCGEREGGARHASVGHGPLPHPQPHRDL